MSYRVRTAAGMLLFLWAALPGPARAQADLVPDSAEQELLQTVRAEKLIRAREQAERVLQSKPDSIFARYALAVVFHDEEGNLPRALYQLRLAEELLTARFGRAPSAAEAKAWHRRFLEEEEGILGEMDRREEQLTVLDRHDALYVPKMDRRRIWPLMKLHRFEEARRLAQQVALSDDLHLRVAALNGLLAIESERLRPRECFQEGLRAIEATGSQSCILLENTAEAAFGVYRFSEVERLSLKSLQATMKDCPASAHPHLANLYLLRGDFQRAMAAVKSAREWGIERRYRQQFEMSNQSWLARLLYTLGKFEKARELAEQVVRAPDRVGMTSYSSDLTKLAALVEYHATVQAHAEELRERASARPLRQRAGLLWALVDAERASWLARRRAVQLMVRGSILYEVTRPYLKMPLPPWNTGALLGVAGRGVMLGALDEARRRETMPRETAPYYEALEGELAYRAGELPRALELGRRALQSLPPDEVLLRGRIAAWTAAAAWRQGRGPEAEPLFHDVLDRFPTALRILRVQLPVDVRADQDPLSQRVAAALLGSPRLTAGDLGFRVLVTRSGRELRLCLQGRGGRRYACAERDVAAARDDEERVAQAIDEFHSRVFAPKIDLTQRDINSLDGSAVRGDADEVLRQVLGQ